MEIEIGTDSHSQISGFEPIKIEKKVDSKESKESKSKLEVKKNQSFLTSIINTSNAKLIRNASPSPSVAQKPNLKDQKTNSQFTANKFNLGTAMGQL